MAIIGSYIMVSGIKTYYETNNGPADKPTIVCLHTAGRECRQYHRMMELFEGRYKMVAFDMPAHGKSWPLPGNKAINNHKDYCAFVWTFVEALGIEKPLVIGCSVGGNMVYYIAQHYPVGGIVSMQGSTFIKALSGAYGTVVDLLDHPYISVQHSHFDFSESLIGRECPQEAKDFILWGVAQECGVAKKGDLSIYNNYDVRGNLDKITCPVLVIRGEDDWNVPEHYCQEAMKGLVNAKKVVWKPIPGYGHFIIVEAPEIVCEAIDDFMQYVEPAASPGCG